MPREGWRVGCGRAITEINSGLQLGSFDAFRRTGGNLSILKSFHRGKTAEVGFLDSFSGHFFLRSSKVRVLNFPIFREKPSCSSQGMDSFFSRGGPLY